MATPIDILIKARDEFSAVTNKARSEISGLAQQTQALARVQVEVSQSAGQASTGLTNLSKNTAKTSQEFHQARQAVQGLSQAIGVQLPAAAQSFLAKSSLIGPALSAAFSGVAVVGLISVIGQLPELFQKIQGSITGWNETAKKAYADFISDNEKAADRVRTLAVELAKINISPIAGTKLDLAQTQAQLELYTKLATLRRNEANQLQAQSGTGTYSSIWNSRQISDLTEQANQFQQKANDAAEAVRKLQGQIKLVTAEEDVRAGKTASEKQAEAQRKLAALIAANRNQLFAYGNEIETQAARNVGLITNVWMTAMDLEQKGRDDYLRHLEGNQAAVDEIIRKNQDHLLQFQNEIDKQNNLAIKPQSDAFVAALEMASKDADDALKLIAKRAQDVIDGIANDIGRMFTDTIAHGANFWDAFKRLGLDAVAAVTNAFVKSLVTRGLTSLLGGSVGGLGGLARSALGISAGIAGMGTAAAAGVAAPLVSTIGTASVINAGAITGGSVAAPGAFAGAGLFGLGSATIPILGAAALGIFGLTKLLQHHTAESPFSQDPNVTQERTMFFYASHDLADAVRDLTALNGRFSTMPAGVVVKDGLPAALQSSNQFRRNLSGSINDDI